MRSLIVILTTILLNHSGFQVHGGPPLQSEVPIGLYPNDNDQVLLSEKSSFGIFSQEDTHRLPLSVQPIHYDLEIRPILLEPTANDPVDDVQFNAPGKVVIRVKCVEGQTNRITLHSQEIEIKHDQVTVVSIDSNEGSIPVTGHEIVKDRLFYMILLEKNLTSGQEYLITIPFISLIGQNRLNGLYLSSYKEPSDGSSRSLALTKFEKQDASKMFPCFDEPGTVFRATFNFKVGRKEGDGYHTLANMEKVGNPEPIPGLDGWFWDNTTVSMPTYLVAILVSDFKSETAPEELYRLPTKTWGPPPLITETSGKFSAQAAARILTFFEEYFDNPYQLSKMDSVAIPDFASGAMENWGLNMYRTSYMIWLEEENTRFETWRSAAVIAHELTHQWFGNLVTCEWWNDLWLNEGFARYMQFIAANYSGEDFRSLDRYVIDVTQLAMAYDETDATEPVHGNATDRVVSQASRVVYEKAAGLIRMMQSFLTEDTLIKGLRNYLKRHEYTGVHQDDLFTALTEQASLDDTFTQFTVKEIMDTWTLQSGFPLVRVSRVDSTRLYISQERFHANPTTQKADHQLWYIPISYVTASNPDFSADNTKPSIWIDKSTILQSLTVNSTNEWIIINPDARGFYRVIYDNHLTQLIQQQLESDHTKISFASRSQLIDDYFRSASAKYINIQSAINLTRYLHKENDFIVWTTVVNNFGPLYTRLTDTKAYENFRQYILRLIIEPLQKIGVDQVPTELAEIAILRTQLLDYVCSLEHEICRETTEKLFSEWMNAITPPEKVPHGPTAVADIISTLVPYLSMDSLTDLPNQVNNFIDEILSNQNLPSNVRTSLESSKSTLVQNTDWMRFYFNDIYSWLSEYVKQ